MNVFHCRQEDYGPPSYWPISYLYMEPPPNETDHWMPDRHPSHAYHDHNEDSPRIRFKQPNNKSAYPKATVQKLDVKDTPPAADPGDEMPSEEEKSPSFNPRTNYAKKLETDGKNSNSEHQPASGGCGEKENLKNQVEQFSSSTLAPFLISENTTIELSTMKRELSDKLQVSNESESSNKTKEVIKKIEKIIEENSKENETISESMSKTMDKSSSESIGVAAKYVTRRLRPKEEDDAMTRFWNWGQEKYSLNE